MNSEIFYEDESKCYDYETPYSSETELHSSSVVVTKAIAESTTTTPGALYRRDDETSYAINNYEIVNNEEFDEEQAEQEQHQFQRLSRHTMQLQQQQQDVEEVDLRQPPVAFNDSRAVDFNAGNAMSKLHLSLSAEKISLKSQKAKKKINKSIEKSKSKRKRETQQQQQQQNVTKTEALTIDAITQHQQQQQQQQQQPQKLRHAPVINFTIAPIGCVRHNSKNGGSKCCTNNNTDDDDDVGNGGVGGGNTIGTIDKRLPEIVLPSTSSSVAATMARQKQCANATSRAVSVTFRAAAVTTATATTTPIASSTMTATTLKASGTTPPVERRKTDVTPSKQITMAEVYVAQDTSGAVATATAARRGRGRGGGGGGGLVRADVDNEINNFQFGHIRDGGIVSGGCGGSSTSPESLMDNVLSAASSVSVRSSSSSSSQLYAAAAAVAATADDDDTAIIDLVKIPPPPTPPPPPPMRSQSHSPLPHEHSRAFCDYAMPRPMRTLNPTKIPSIAFTTLTEQMPSGRATSNPRIISTTTTITSNCNATTITTAWIHQQPMPSVTISSSTPSLAQRRDDFDSLKPLAAMYEVGRISPVSFRNEMSESERLHTMRSSRSRSPSPLMTAHSIKTQLVTSTTTITTPQMFPPLTTPSSSQPQSQPATSLALKCFVCDEFMRDPRTLNCLHSFCLQCLVAEENVRADGTNITFWSLPTNSERRFTSSTSATSATVPSVASEQDANDAKSVHNSGIGGAGGASAATTYSKCNGESVHSQSPETSSASCSPSRRTSFNFIRKKSLEKILLRLRPDNSKNDGNTKLTPVSGASVNSDHIPTTTCTASANAVGRVISCKICNYATEVPVGGLRQLPQNLLLARKIDAFKRQQQLQEGGGVATTSALLTSARLWCSLCVTDTEAVFQCLNCALYLCTLCKESHERQRNTASHKLQLLPIEVRRKLRTETCNANGLAALTKLKCSMHGGYEMKAFCSTCLQVACADCLVLLHRGHKHETISKAVANYARILSESAEQTRPLCTYAEHTIAQLNEIAEHVNSKCDHVQAQLEAFIEEYLDAVEAHRKTLLQQLQRAREAKLHMLLEQQAELAKRTKEASEAVRFTQELATQGSDAELLSFVSVLLRRFEYCQQLEAPDETKICDTLKLLRQVRAPDVQQYFGIPLYGIITTQAVAPSLCALDWDSGGQLRLRRKIELTLVTRDCHNLPLSHGGLTVHARLRHKCDKDKTPAPSSSSLPPAAPPPPPPPVVVSDNRDGTYTLTFTPNATGQVLLSVSINDKAIKGSPFEFHVNCTRPHTGVYHCCAQCSAKGGNRQRMQRCACTPNGTGCVHGQPGHPGVRHWSCCGSPRKHSECGLNATSLPPAALPTAVTLPVAPVLKVSASTR